MEKIIVTTDSACDLTDAILKENNIPIVNLIINLDDETFYDRSTIFTDDIYSYVEKTGRLPKTAALSGLAYEDFFRPYIEDGYTVIHISLGSKLSANCQNARMAAKELGNIYVVDSCSLSTGSALVTLEISDMVKENNLTAAEIVNIAETDIVPNVDASFVVDTMEYLKKGGRCSSLAAFSATLIKLHPSLVMRDGSINVGKKYRGNMDKVIIEYAKDRLADSANIRSKRIFVTHTDCDEETVESVKKIVNDTLKVETVLETTAGSTIACHCGKGTLGMLFIRKYS